MQKYVLYLSSIIILLSTTVFTQSGKYRSGIFMHHSTGYDIWGHTNPTGNTVPKEIVKYNDVNDLLDADSVKMTELSWPLADASDGGS